MKPNGQDRYEAFFERTAASYKEAKEVVGEIRERRIAAREELDTLIAEEKELRTRLADFGRGEGEPMTASEYQEASYRVQWLAGASRAQSRILAGVQEEEGTAGRKVASVYYGAISALEAMLAADAKAAAAEARARLKQALGEVQS